MWLYVTALVSSFLRAHTYPFLTTYWAAQGGDHVLSLLTFTDHGTSQELQMNVHQ